MSTPKTATSNAGTAVRAVDLQLISPQDSRKIRVTCHLLKSGVDETTVDMDGKTAVRAATRRMCRARAHAMANAPAGKVQLREKRRSAHAGVAWRIRSGSKLLHTGGLAGGSAVVDERIVLGSEEISVKTWLLA